MAQNTCDNPEFFAGYSRLNRSIEGLDGAEWPALRAPLPVAAQPALAEDRERPVFLLLSAERQAE